MNKIINKKSITVCTILIYLLMICIFEIGYCNSNFFINQLVNKTTISYNFSLVRIIFYLLTFIIYIIVKDKFIEEAMKVANNEYKRFFIYISIVISILIFVFYTIVVIHNPYLIRSMTIGMMTVLMFTIFIIYVSNHVIKNLILVMATFGILFCITTRFNHALDEKKHFMTAFNIANFNLDYEKSPITDEQIEALPQLTKFVNIDAFLEGKYEPKITEEVNIEDVPSTPTNYPFFSYLFSAFGIWCAKTIGGSIIDIYIIGRIFNLLLYGILITIAVKLLPFKKNILAIICCMPMLLLLAASYSIDGFCVGVVFIFIAYCMKIYKQCNTISWKQCIILTILFIIMLTAKSMAYMFVCIIVLMLPILKTLKENKKLLPIIITIAILLLIAMIWTGLYIKNTKLNADTRGGNTNVAEQLNILLKHPKHDIKLAMNQLKDTILSFQWYTMLHQNVFFTADSPCMMFIMMLFILYISITEDDENFKIKDKIIMIISFFAVVAMTSMALYLTFTEIGSLHVAGYQTRYIFPILPLILFPISSDKIKVKKSENRRMNIAIISGIFLFIGMIQSIIV